MTDYTPRTIDVLYAYLSNGTHGSPDHNEEDFDRWLSNVKADAWDEAMTTADIWYLSKPWERPDRYPPNPYRKAP